MKTLSITLALLALLVFTSPALASGNCFYSGTTLVSCSGMTDGQYVSGQYVSTSRGYVYVDGYYAPGYYYAFTCSHFGSTWSCTQSIPSYSTWTVTG